MKHMKTLILALMGLNLFSQNPVRRKTGKPNTATLAPMTIEAPKPFEPPALVWDYSTPPDYQFLEPSYRFPVQVKQALMKYVKGRTTLEGEFDEIFQDKNKFKPWIVSIIIKYIDSSKSRQEIAQSTADKMRALGQDALAQADKTRSRLLLNQAEICFNDANKYRDEVVQEIGKQGEAERLLKVIRIWAEDKSN